MPVVLLVVGGLLFALAVMLSLADTGEGTDWYSWSALAASAVAVVAGVVSIVCRRRAGRDSTG